jgi:hypothetical protein
METSAMRCIQRSLTQLQRNLTQVAIALLFLGVSATSLLAQDVKNRELKPEFDFTTIQMPVEIVSIKLKGKELRPGEQIKGDDDWLQGLSFSLKNISGQPISYVAVGLRFPRANGIVVYVLSHGVDLSYGQPVTELLPPALKPGETLDLVLTKEKYASFLRILAAGEGSKSTETVPYHIARVCFENDRYLIWEGGYLKRRDPNLPGKYNVVERYVLPAKQN